MLRKGPQDIPHSSVALLMAILFWLATNLIAQLMLFGLSSSRYVLEIGLALVALAIYYLVLIISGKRDRSMQTITAIIGVGSVIWILFVFSTFLFWRFLGQLVLQFAVAAFMIWSVAAKGHIIATALDRRWAYGAALALIIVILQLVISNFLNV